MQSDGLPRSVSRHFFARKHSSVSWAGSRSNPPLTQTVGRRCALELHLEAMFVSHRVIISISVTIITCMLCGALGYARYVDWPSFDGSKRVREYLPSQYPIQDAHFYQYRNFMDNWDLYRFTTSPAAIEFLAASLHLSLEGVVHEFPLIISRPPPYWWHPELLPEADLYRSSERAPGGHLYDLLYSQETGIAYLIQFDG